LASTEHRLNDLNKSRKKADDQYAAKRRTRLDGCEAAKPKPRERRTHKEMAGIKEGAPHRFGGERNAGDFAEKKKDYRHSGRGTENLFSYQSVHGRNTS